MLNIKVFFYLQYIDNYENASWDQNLYTRLAGLYQKRVRYSGVLLYD